LVAASTFAFSGAAAKYYKKHKQKYEDLREEAVLKLYVSWKVREDSKLRDEISSFLKQQKNINLRYTK
jgi:Mlc titration factor MtfA (ptsG expression regulator)